MTDPLTLDPKRTALVLIDLQRGIMGRQTAPHAASDVLARSNELAKRFRELGAPVVLVNVSFSPTVHVAARQARGSADVGVIAIVQQPFPHALRVRARREWAHIDMQ